MPTLLFLTLVSLPLIIPLRASWSIKESESLTCERVWEAHNGSSKISPGEGNLKDNPPPFLVVGGRYRHPCLLCWGLHMDHFSMCVLVIGALYRTVLVRNLHNGYIHQLCYVDRYSIARTVTPRSPRICWPRVQWNSSGRQLNRYSRLSQYPAPATTLVSGKQSRENCTRLCQVRVWIVLRVYTPCHTLPATFGGIVGECGTFSDPDGPRMVSD